ncbi:MAG TPA: PilZ domain-containing protein [Candidatus Acidoferrales bacterium]
MSDLQGYFGAVAPARDRRLQERTTPASLAYVMLGDSNGGIVLNISEMGMAVAVADLLVGGDYLPRIRFQLPSSSQSIEISGQIVWLAASKQGAGIRFVDLTADARNQISNWIASEKRQFEQVPKLLRRDNQPLETGSRKSKTIFSNPSVCDEETATRYAEMFPSESTYAKRTSTIGEIKPQKDPLPIPTGTHTDAGISMFARAAEISMGDVPQSLAASFPSEHAKNFAPEPIKTSIPELSHGLAPESVESQVPPTLENSPTEPIGNFSPDQVQTFSPEMISHIAPQASESVAPLSLVEDLQEKVHHDTPVAGFGPQVRTDRVESSGDRVEDSPSHFHILEISGFQVAVFVVLFAVIGFTVGLTVERGPLRKRLRDTQKSILAVDATSPTLPDRPGETTSPTSTPPAANTFNTPEVTPPASEAKKSRLESRSAQSLKAPHADSATRLRPTGPSPAVTNRSNIDSDDSSGANKLDDPMPSEENSKESTPNSESLEKVPSADSNSYPIIESRPSASPESSAGHDGSTGPIEGNAPPPANPEPARSPKAVGPISAVPRNPAPRSVTPPRSAAPYQPPRPGILVTAPSEGGKPIRVIFPEKLIAVSSSFAITSRFSVLVFPQPGPAVAHQPARMQVGELVSYVEPRLPRSGYRYGSTETVKVRVTIGQLGQVMGIRPVSGPISLLPAAMSAIRVWRYKPTLLNERPVQAQQDVTIELRPPLHGNKAPG